MSTATVDQVIEALRPVEDPELHRSIVDLGMVNDVAVSSQGISLTVTLTVAGCPMRNEIQTRVTQALAPLSGAPVSINFGVMTDEQRAHVRTLLNGDPSSTAGSQQAHGHAEGRTIPFAQKNSKTRPLLISSGKGGVGKSSVTTNLAVALAALGNTVGVLDADIYGFSIPRMLGADVEPVVIDGMILPVESYGVRCFSMGHVNRENKAIVWRGPMLHKALEQFLTDVYWDEPDYLLVDMPPGTGDIAMSLASYLPTAEVIVVTTPQEAAQTIAHMSARMAKVVNLPVRGVIENMSWFTGDDGKKYEIFGSGGGKKLADEIGVPLLGQIPLVPLLREGGDEGKPIAAVQPDSEAGKAFHALAAEIDAMKPKKKFSKGLKLL